MIIGGFQKNSLIDFPETIACVVFTQGCNFKCPYCHNPDLVAGPRNGSGRSFDPAGIFQFLERRKGMLEGVVITGGEPTLQKDLVDFCRTVKAIGYRLKMDTNGTRPSMMADLLGEGLIDYVAMDIKTRPDDYPMVWPDSPDTGAIRRSIDLIMSQAPDYEFRTTCAKPFVSIEKIHEMGGLIQGAKQYILQHCSKNVTVLDPGFLKQGDPFFTQEEMETLREIANKYAAAVFIR